MTTNEILGLAWHYGIGHSITLPSDDYTLTATGSQLEAFVRRIQQAERERCAKVCETRRDLDLHYGHTKQAAGADDCARMIRGGQA